jgi:hypothetical protein
MKPVSTAKPDRVRIEREAAILAELLPKVRRHSLFGDDNHAAIEAQIAVLREDLDDDDIIRRFDEGDDEDRASCYVVDAAIEARCWRDGEAPDAPSEDWATLASAR